VFAVENQGAMIARNFLRSEPNYEYDSDLESIGSNKNKSYHVVQSKIDKNKYLMSLVSNSLL
jgi:hypothetical protein